MNDKKRVTEITFCEQNFTGQAVEHFSFRPSHDGTQLGIELSTAAGRTFRFVVPGVDLLALYFEGVRKAERDCGQRMTPETPASN